VLALGIAEHLDIIEHDGFRVFSGFLCPAPNAFLLKQIVSLAQNKRAKYIGLCRKAGQKMIGFNAHLSRHETVRGQTLLVVAI